jgi:hypothetical protein
MEVFAAATWKGETLQLRPLSQLLIRSHPLRVVLRTSASSGTERDREKCLVSADFGKDGDVEVVVLGHTLNVVKGNFRVPFFFLRNVFLRRKTQNQNTHMVSECTRL